MANKKEVEKFLEDPRARELIKDAGFRLSRAPEGLVAKTFKLPKELVDDFYKAVQKEDMKIQDAIEDAIKMWLNSRG